MRLIIARRLLAEPGLALGSGRAAVPGSPPDDGAGVARRQAL